MITETIPQLERLREVAELRHDLMASMDEILHDRIAAIETNVLDCPEIRHYQRQALEGVIVITYEVRQPGKSDWQPVRIVTLT